MKFCSQNLGNGRGDENYHYSEISLEKIERVKT